jgi:hypothetical protein
MKLIESKTLGTAQASIEFTSIPQTFTDLVVVASVRQNSRTSGNGGFVFKLTFNASGSNYSSRILRGSGSGVTSYTDTSIIFFGGASDDTSNTFGNASIYVPNYTAATNKSVSIDSVNETNGTTAYQGIAASLWSVTDAINSIQLSGAFGDNLVAGSMVSLYGVLKGSSGGVTVS